MLKICEVLKLSAKGLTQHHVAQRCSIGQATVHRYLKLAKVAKVVWPLREDWGEEKLQEVLLGKRSGVKRRVNSPPDFTAIHKELQTNANLTLKLIWQKYKQQKPEGYGYSRFCDLCTEWCRCQNVTLRPRHRSDERTFGYHDGATIPVLVGRQAAFDWMLNLLQGALPLNALTKELDGVALPELECLLASITREKLSIRNKSMAVLADLRGISYASIGRFLRISKFTSWKYCMLYREGGTKMLFARKSRATKSDKDSTKIAVFALLHSPPSEHGINPTSWKMTDLARILREQGHPICADIIRKTIKEAGYKWRRARVVLTSTDPEYRTKVDGIKKILSELGQDEAFFSIDEYGPFAVKQKGGTKRVAPGQEYVVPQWQRSKGWMILTAALELSRNQVTHFYSRKKNTEEMIKMANLLRAQYHTCSTIYLSWDAASWHISKKLLAHLQQLNQKAARDGCPVVKTAPLPAGAQFLNVIEAVFSGMARAIIHNSDYPSVETAKDAIDLYFNERNGQFSKHPKRAGYKIWGKERVPSEFFEGQNCKDPLYR